LNRPKFVMVFFFGCTVKPFKGAKYIQGEAKKKGRVLTLMTSWGSRGLCTQKKKNELI